MVNEVVIPNHSIFSWSFSREKEYLSYVMPIEIECMGLKPKEVYRGYINGLNKRELLEEEWDIDVLIRIARGYEKRPPMVRNLGLKHHNVMSDEWVLEFRRGRKAKVKYLRGN